MRLELWEPMGVFAANRRFMLHSNVTFYSRLINFAAYTSFAFLTMISKTRLLSK